jgi:heme/copper-type cytochrome/quinol oxidase subunit 2
MRRAIVIAAFSILVVGVLTVPWRGTLPVPGEREVVVRARQYAYAPGVIRVPQGERVTLVLESEDMTHGLYVDGYAVKTEAVPGRPGRVRFVADRPGKFYLRCSKVCGPLHPFMLGELVVEPNRPFWRAAALVVLLGVGTVAFLALDRRPTGC